MGEGVLGREHRERKVGSEVRGHVASDHGGPGRSCGASPYGSELKAGVWPRTIWTSPQQCLLCLNHSVSIPGLGWAGAEKSLLSDLWGNGPHQGA